MTPKILFEDEDILVVHKQSGVAVQTARVQEADYVSILKNHRAQRGEEPYIALINRLDQPVEGVVLFAKNPRAAAELSGQLARGAMEKYYLAVVTNRNLPDEKELVDYIRKDTATNRSLIVPEGTKDAKKAVLKFRVVERRDALALVRIHLITGRHHQIRAQMANRGWQIFGDCKYGAVRENVPHHPLALCAYRLVFIHPRTKEKLTYEISPEGEAFHGFKV